MDDEEKEDMEERGDEKEVQLNDKNYIEKKSTEKRKEDLGRRQGKQ